MFLYNNPFKRFFVRIYMKNKQVGNLLITISAIVGFVFLIFGISASVIAGKSILLTTQMILGLLMFLGIAIIGSTIKKRKEKTYTDIPQVEIIKFDNDLPAKIETPIKEIEEPKEEIKKPKSKPKKTTQKKTPAKKGLTDEQKKVIKYLKKAAENEIMQSDLIKKLKVTKVKMTRILKKLEEQDLILKKKVGMTNIVVLK